MRGLAWVALLCGVAWGQGVVVRPPEVEAGAKPELLPPLGHAGPVTALAYSPDGRRLASSGLARVVIWDTATRVATATVIGGGQGCATFSPDGRTLAVGFDQALLLRDMATAQVRNVPLRGAYLSSLAYSSDGHYLVAGSGDGRLLGLDLAGNMLLLSDSAGTGAVKQVSFAAQTLTVASVWSRRLCLWRVGGLFVGGPALPMIPQLGIEAAAVSPTGEILAVAGVTDKAVSLWDVTKGSLIANMAVEGEVGVQALGEPIGRPLAVGASVVSLAFSPDGSILGAACGDGAVRMWETASWRLRGSPMGGHDPACIAFSPDGRTLATGSRAGTIQLWDVASGLPRGDELGGMRADSAFSVALAPSGGVAASAGAGGTIRLWLVSTGQPVGALTGHRADVDALAFSSDCRTLVSGDLDGNVRFWDVGAGRARGGPVHHSFCVWGVAVTRDGRTAASVALDRTVKLWDVESGTQRGAIAAGSRLSRAIAFSPDGATLFTPGGDDGFGLLDVGTSKVSSRRLDGAIADLGEIAFSGDGTAVATGDSQGGLRFWDAATGQARNGGALPPGKHLTFLWLAPDGHAVAGTAHDDPGRVVVLDAATGKVRGEPLVHKGMVVCVAFVPGDRAVATTDGTGPVRLWDSETGRQLASIFDLADGHGYLVATPEGYYDCSLDASQAPAWRLGNSFYPFDQFSDKFNRPDLVRRALAGEDISNAPPLDATQLPPNLGFIAPQYGAEVAGDKVDVELQAAGKYPIRRLDLTVNGTPLPTDLARQLDVDKPDQTTRTFKLTVPLPPDEPRVRLRAVAYDTESLKSRVEEVTLFRPGVKAGVGALHVLAVGIDRYPKLSEQYQLRYAVPDAQAVAEALGKLGGGKPYTEVKTKLLCDAEATVTNLKFALRELKDSATENDVAVIFVSGHGVADKAGAFYFPTCEVDLNDIPGTALSWQDFVGALREVRAKRVLVLADTCHSGAVVGQGQSADEQLARRLNKEGHRLVFAASGRDETSIGRPEWGHGAFSKALLEALEGKADGDKDGQITFAELRDYVPGRVAELTENRQHPQLPFLDSFEPEAVLAMVR